MATHTVTPSVKGTMPPTLALLQALRAPARLTPKAQAPKVCMIVSAGQRTTTYGELLLPQRLTPWGYNPNNWRSAATSAHKAGFAQEVHRKWVDTVRMRQMITGCSALTLMHARLSNVQSLANASLRQIIEHAPLATVGLSVVRATQRTTMLQIP